MLCKPTNDFDINFKWENHRVKSLNQAAQGINAMRCTILSLLSIFDAIVGNYFKIEHFLMKIENLKKNFQKNIQIEQKKMRRAMWCANFQILKSRLNPGKSYKNF